MAGLNLGWLGIAPKKWNKAASNFMTGTPEKRENVSTLRPEQEQLYQQAVNAGMNPGAGGAFGTSADYYRNLLSDNSADFNAMAAPQLRQYNQDIIPGISEQFAGMGPGLLWAGGLSSSGFQNAQVQGATDLSERLGAIRANLRQAGAQGLQNIGQLGLGNYSQNMVTQPGTQGFLSSIAPAIGNAVGQYGGNWLSSKIGSNTSPYGGNSSAISSPQTQTTSSIGMSQPGGGFNLPNFMGGR